MPDISMCPGTNCPLREDCYRYQAKPDKYYQSYFTEVPYDDFHKDCDFYWKMEEKKKSEEE